MDESNDGEWHQGVQASVHYLLDGIDFDHAAVVSNVAAQRYVNYRAHETSDLEDDDCPPLVFFIDERI